MTQDVHVTFRMLDRGVSPPQRAHPDDAGFDLVTSRDLVLEPGQRVTAPTGVAVAIPEGHAGLVLPRSGHAARFGIGIVNAPGLVDAGYRGEVKVLLVNHGDERVTFRRGDRIAQLVVIALPAVTLTQADALPPSARGADGFGSTGR